MRKFGLLLALACVLLVGCAAPGRVSTLDSANGGMPAAYHGKIDDMLVDLRALLIRFFPYAEPEFVDEGRVKGYRLAAHLKFMFVPVKGLTDKGATVDAYAFEIFNAYGPPIYYYKKLKPELDAKYPLVRVK